MPPTTIHPADAALPIFDEEVLLTQLAGDRDLARTIIQSAMGDLPGYFDRFEVAVATGDWKAAEKLSHTMKSLVAQIGGIRLARRLKDVNDPLKHGATTDIATVTALRAEYEALTDAVTAWMR